MNITLEQVNWKLSENGKGTDVSTVTLPLHKCNETDLGQLESIDAEDGLAPLLLNNFENFYCLGDTSKLHMENFGDSTNGSCLMIRSSKCEGSSKCKSDEELDALFKLNSLAIYHIETEY